MNSSPIKTRRRSACSDLLCRGRTLRGGRWLRPPLLNRCADQWGAALRIL